MIRLLVWLAGCIGCAYVIYRFQYMHLALAFAFLTFTGLWVTVGAFICTRNGAAKRPASGTVPFDNYAQRAAQEALERDRKAREGVK
jgi:hypothetical protein